MKDHFICVLKSKSNFVDELIWQNKTRSEEYYSNHLRKLDAKIHRYSIASREVDTIRR